MNYDRPHLSIMSVILCDDIRTEVTGKEILIGVYNHVMIVRELPFTMRTTFRVALVLNKPELKHCAFAVHDPDGEAMVSMNGADLPTTAVGEPLVCGFGVANLTFKKEGTYTFLFGVEEPVQPTMKFNVTLPRNADEVARVRA